MTGQNRTRSKASSILIRPSTHTPLPDFNEVHEIGADKRYLIRFMFAQIPPDFSFPLPDRSHTIFGYIYPVIHFAQREK